MPLLEETYEKLLVAADPNSNGAGGGGGGAGDDLDASQYFKIIDSFDLPAWRWDDVRGGFERCVSSLVLREFFAARSSNPTSSYQA